MVKNKSLNKDKIKKHRLGDLSEQIFTDEDIEKMRQEINKARPNTLIKPLSAYSSTELAMTFLKIAGMGILVMVALSGRPSMSQIYRLFKAHSDKDKDRIRHLVRRYNRRGLVRLKDGRLMTTADGDRLLDTYKARNLYFKPPVCWDGKWFMVTFDVPGKYENERKILREKLNALGFLKYQDSLFISPYDCTEVIDKLKKFLALDSYVRYFVVELQNEKEEKRFKKKFKLT